MLLVLLCLHAVACKLLCHLPSIAARQQAAAQLRPTCCVPGLQCHGLDCAQSFTRAA